MLAIQFYKTANILKDYDIDTTIDNLVASTKSFNNITSTDLYNALSGDKTSTKHIYDTEGKCYSNVGDLLRTIDRYPISYGQMYDAIGKAASIADKYCEGESVISLIQKLAYCLSITTANPSIPEGTSPWDADRNFQPNNRVTQSSSNNTEMYDSEHVELIQKYNALSNAINEIEANNDHTICAEDTSGIKIVLKDVPIKNDKIILNKIYSDIMNNMLNRTHNLTLIMATDISLASGIHIFNEPVYIELGGLEEYAGQEVSLIHLLDNDTLDIQYNTVSTNGVLSGVSATSLSPFILVLGHATVKDDIVKTGDNVNSCYYYLLILASGIVFTGLSFYIIVKYKKDKRTQL